MLPAAPSELEQAGHSEGRLPLAVLTVVAFAVRQYGLGRQALWADELQRVTWAKGYEFDRDFGVFAYETGIRAAPHDLADALDVVSRHNPPLNGALLNLWLRLTGDAGDAMARMPSAVFSAAAVPVTYHALRERLGSRASMVAAALVALSPFHVHHAQEVNHYALAFLAIATSFFFFLRYAESRARGAGVGWALAAVAAIYTHYYAAIVIAFQWAALALDARPWRSSVRSLLWPPALMASLLLPYVPRLTGQLREMTSEDQIGAYRGMAYFLERTLANLVSPYLGEAADHLDRLRALPVAAFGVCLLVFGLRKMQGRDCWTFALGVVGPFVLVSAGFFVRKTNSLLWPRYQLFFSFALFAAVATAITTSRRWLAAAGATILALFAAGLFHQSRIVREDWRTVARLIDLGAAPDEPVLVYRQNLVYAVARYLRGRNRLFGIGPAPELERTLASLVPSQVEGPGVWYASAWSQGSDMDRRVMAFLARRYDRCDRQPVDPGVVSLTLTHCAGVRPESAAEVPSFALPRPGPLQENGVLERVTVRGVHGWAFSSAGTRAIRVVVGERVVAEGPHVGLPRPDVSKVFSSMPRDLTEPSGFFLSVDLTEDEARRARVFGVHADGSLFEPRDLRSP